MCVSFEVFTVGMPSQNKSLVFLSCLLTGEDEKPRATKFLVVLGDDPKPEPKPRRRERKLLDERTKPFYNHCKWWCHDSKFLYLYVSE